MIREGAQCYSHSIWQRKDHQTLKQLNIWQTLQSDKIIKLERRQKRNYIITYNISQPPKRAKTQRRWWTDNSINNYSLQNFSISKWIKVDIQNSTIIKDKRKCKNPIICKVSKTDFKRQFNPYRALEWYIISNTMSISNIAETRQLSPSHHRWRWSIRWRQ